ncbi:MAG TPA: transketolase [Anaerolineales bacterium]|nr:transketolase [Anaerolineales bacterium]
MPDMDTRLLARTIRADALRMVNLAGSSHIGSCLSIADLLAVLYGKILRIDPSNPNWAERDRFILSKGHAAAIYYAVLAERGFFPKAWLENYGQDGAHLGGHVTSHGVPGVELSTGSLGHGLPVGCGMALASKRERRLNRIFVMLSDGELDEGSNWEAILFAPHHQLDNLVVIVDYNKIQSFGSVSEVLNLDSLHDKWQAFGWSVHEVDGHDHIAIVQTLENLPVGTGKPNVVIAHTVKGKGVSFMEDQLEWHYKSPNREQLDLALHELETES